MNEYLATFHTHLSALLTFQALQGADCRAKMQPVPRTLSSSCGTCVRFWAADDCRALLDTDAEGLYAVTPDGFRLLWREKEG
ncbi:MAG: DUF3343 domain-containing protein [Eubacteriales bacterium]|nr:DUF3343 domain-containing protein [Eubacteriales bacterium]